MEQDAIAVITKAKSNLDRWLKHRENDSLCVVYREWENLLVNLSPSEISELIVSEDERATRLRQSSPFVGILTPREVWKIKRGDNHAAA